MPNILAFTTEHHLTAAQRDDLRAELQKQLKGVDCQLLILPAGVALQTIYVPSSTIAIPKAPEQAKTSIVTVTIDTSQVRDTIRKILEPGAVYLPASAVAKVYSRTGASTRLMQECGAIVAVEATPTTPFEDAVVAGRKVVHVDVPDADDKVRFVWMGEGDITEAQRMFAVGKDTTGVQERYAIPVDQLTAHQMQDAKIETL